jgi:hypothetical protein
MRRIYVRLLMPYLLVLIIPLALGAVIFADD